MLIYCAYTDNADMQMLKDPGNILWVQAKVLGQTEILTMIVWDVL